MVRRVWFFPVLFLLCAQLLCAPAGADQKKAAAPDPRAWPAAYEAVTLTAKELLDAVKHAGGELPDPKQGTLRIASTFRDGGLEGTSREVWSGGNYRVDQTAGPFVTSYGKNDDSRWETNENGYTLLKRGIHKRADANARALEEPDKGDDVKLLGRLRAPADAYVLRVAPPGGREERRFYDAASYHLVRRELTYLDRLVVVTYDDYRTVSGVTFPFKQTTSDGHPENDEVENVTLLQIGTIVTPSEVAIPGSRRIPVTLPGDGAAVKLPARIDPFGHIIVRLTVNGRGLDFQLDSGASGIVLNRDVARELGLRTYGRWTTTVAGTFTSTRTIVPRIDIGAVRMDDVVVSALPFAFENDWGTKVVGLLGFDFIAGCVVKIDYANGTVYAIPSERFEVPQNAIVLDAILDDAVPMISMKMNDASGDHFILDTGSDMVVAFSDFAKKNPGALDDHSPHQAVSKLLNVVTANGVGGKLSIHATVLKNMQLGNVLYHDYLAFVMLDDQQAFEGEDADGLAGVPLLRAFDVYLDYANARVVLVPNKFTRPLTPAK